MVDSKLSEHKFIELCSIYNGLYGLVISLAENNSGKEIGRKQTTKETIQADGRVINQEALNDRLAGFMLNQQDLMWKQSILIANLELIILFIFYKQQQKSINQIKTKIYFSLNLQAQQSQH